MQAMEAAKALAQAIQESLLCADSRTSGYLMAEMRLQKMMADIFGVLTQAAGMEIPLPV